VLSLLAAVDHEDLNLVLRFLLVHNCLDIPIVSDEHGANLIKVVKIFALLDDLHDLVLLFLFFPLFFFFVLSKSCDQSIGIPVVVNELFTNFFEVRFPVASLDNLNDLLFSFLFKFLLLLFLFRDHVCYLVVVPVLLLQIHLGHIVVAV